MTAEDKDRLIAKLEEYRIKDTSRTDTDMYNVSDVFEAMNNRLDDCINEVKNFE